jgi:hypothetical protein
LAIAMTCDELFALYPWCMDAWPLCSTLARAAAAAGCDEDYRRRLECLSIERCARSGCSEIPLLECVEEYCSTSPTPPECMMMTDAGP